MKVTKISITSDPVNRYTPEEIIVYTARVSNPNNQANMETGPKLLKYLIKHKHWSPFEMVDMTVEIKTSRAIETQILRHRSFSFQSFSQRYSNVTNIEEMELRRQGKTNRQSSSEVIVDEALMSRVNGHFDTSLELYEDLITSGIAREVARGVLPLNTQTTLYMKGSIRSWLSYLNVRLEEGTQKEHRLIAQEIAELLAEEFPSIVEATNNFNNYTGNFM